MGPALGRRLWLLVGGALLLTAILVFVSGRGATAHVAVINVVRENLSSVVSTNGKVEPVMPVTFRAEFPTFVVKVFASEGQQVKRGQLLFQLDDTGTRAELAQARADLAAEQETLRVSRAGGRSDQVAKVVADLQKARDLRDQLNRENESLTKLVAQKAATPLELEQNRLALAQAEADLQSLEKVKQTYVSQAKVDIGHATLLVENAEHRIADLTEKLNSAHGVATMDGTLYALPIRQGDFVKDGDLLAEMADLRHVQVRAFIDEPELGQIEPNQAVDIFWDAHPDRTWSGHTEMVPKQVVSHGTRNVGELLCTVSNDRLDLIPNTTVDVRIHISERPNVLTVPRGAVYIDGRRRFVFVVTNNRLHRTYIDVGIANPTMIEVLSGLHQGDEVALPGEVSLKENLHIQPVRPE
jgi:HlyD family secretion protein